jgi:hypothetical protein
VVSIRRRLQLAQQAEPLVPGRVDRQPLCQRRSIKNEAEVTTTLSFMSTTPTEPSAQLGLPTTCRGAGANEHGVNRESDRLTLREQPD